MTAVFVLMFGAIASLHFLAKNRYRDFIKPVDKGEFPLKSFLPIGLYILDAFRYTYATRLDRKILVKIAELHGLKNARYYLQVYWANRILLLLAGLLLTSAIGIASGPDPALGVFFIILTAGVIYFSVREIDIKVKRRRTAIQMDFPDFLNKLALLINAGMTLHRAWEKAVRDCKKQSLLYKELENVLAEIRAGKPECQAYEDFAKRCRIQEVTRFVSVIIQNMKKGNAEMVSMLRLQSGECWEMRKNTARRLGEEASTKMLLPLMIMFAAILIIVAVPAILALEGI